MTLENTILQFKNMIEHAIVTASFDGKCYANGQKAKEALIRSQKLINLLHEQVKHSLLENNINISNIFPPIGNSSPELKLTGFFKQKNQDVCIVPNNLNKYEEYIHDGPLSPIGICDIFGRGYTENILSINVRSQLSSLSKNTDTLFERTYAEAYNLHLRCPKMVLGEVYLIPVFEYDEEYMNKNQISFKPNRVNLEKYISFFSNINGRLSEYDSYHNYERCALIIVDFSKPLPIIYKNTQSLKNANLIDPNFNIELANISFDYFVRDLINVYDYRFDLRNIVNEIPYIY